MDDLENKTVRELLVQLIARDKLVNKSKDDITEDDRSIAFDELFNLADTI